jgi:hypothetical protein
MVLMMLKLLVCCMDGLQNVEGSYDFIPLPMTYIATSISFSKLFEITLHTDQLRWHPSFPAIVIPSIHSPRIEGILKQLRTHSR